MSFISINIGCRLTQEGREYRGNISVTMDGFTCQAWTSQTSNPHAVTDLHLFPDHTLEEAQNFCRNPDENRDGPWCYGIKYTGLILNGRQTCSVPVCNSINTSMIYVPLLISHAPYPSVVLTL